MKNNIVGGWELVEWKTEDEHGDIDYPFGKRVTGIIMYTPDGYMSANIIATGREKLILDGLSLESMLQGKGVYLSYSGTYTLYADKVVHHVKVALIPEWIGEDQERDMEFKDNYLILRAELVLNNGISQQHTLTWKKVVSS